MSFFGQRNTHDKLVTVAFVILTAILIVVGIHTWKEWRHRTPDIDFSRYPVRGIDVSAHNGDIDFHKVRDSGIDFVFIKASEGESFRDKKFSANYEGATSAGLQVGAYHFFRFDNDGVMQAMNLCQALGDRRLPLGVAIDIEEENNARDFDPEKVEENLMAMLDYLKMRGYGITLYSNKDGYYDFIAKYLSNYPLWICSFTDNPIDAEWTYWQYSHSGDVPGIEGNVDMNLFNGSLSDWHQLFNPLTH